MRLLRTPQYAVLILAVGIWGCRPSSNAPSRIEQYGTLPGLRASADPRLQEELARIEEVGGTPEALNGPDVAADENVATVLKEIFPDRRLTSLTEYSDGLFPTNGFEFGPLHLEKALAFRDDQSEALEKCRQALDRPHCDFGINHKLGFANDLDFIDRVRLCARLEAFDAAERLHVHGDVDGTLENVGRMLRWAGLLAAEKNVLARRQAGAIRDEIASVIVEVAHSPKATPRHLAEAARLVYDTLESWTPDSHAWIGERAAVLHAYEAIRDGRIIGFLTPEEIDELAGERSLIGVTKALKRSVDSDELFYMQAMRRIIDGCADPYLARRNAFGEIETAAEALKGTTDYPLAAIRLFMKDIDAEHLEQALDRAQYEALYLALSYAAGKPSDRFKTSALSGKPYVVRRDGSLVVVEDGGSELISGVSIAVPVKAEGRNGAGDGGTP